MIYPIGIQNFESLRNDGYVYVDKTEHIYRLATTGRYYFLSRPRRFGKSLLISTMEAYFSGQKELFTGLALERLEQKWTKHPILHLDLNSRKYEDVSDLIAELNKHLESWEKLYGNEFKDRAVEERFSQIIELAYLHTGERVVILVDEYDKPMLQTIGNEQLQEKYRNILKAFYSVLKTQDRYIKFAFLTGVTKFGKVSVFSDLNNLKDISMDKRFVDICGISEDEISAYFGESVHRLAGEYRLSDEETRDKLKEQYNGYHFRENCIGVYNPFSLLNTFDKNEFKHYWFETGTPSFLVHLLKQSDYDLNELQQEEVSADVLNSIDSMSHNPIPVIYQSGYLTIKDYDERFRMYRLGFPNKEVEEGFTKYLLPFYTPVQETKTDYFISRFVADMERGNPDGFMQRLQTMFEDADYEVVGKMEKYFQNCLYVIFKMMGFYTEVERRTARGRIDVVVKTKDYIYIIECKLDGSAEEALSQIEEKGYARPFAMDERTVYKIGINFSSQTRGIGEWCIR